MSELNEKNSRLNLLMRSSKVLFEAKTMKFFLIYIIPLFFTITLSYSFYEKWGRIAQVNFDFNKSNLSLQDQALVAKELKEKIKPYIGKWIWQLSINKLSQIVKSHSQIEQVHILRKWPSRYLVYLPAEQPILLLIGNKIFHPLTSKGTMTHPISFSNLPDLPFLRGLIFLKEKEWREKVIRLFLYLPKAGLFSQNNISEIKYSKPDQSFYFYLMDSGLPIRVGENASEFRPDRVGNVLKYLNQKKVKWRVIDARFSQKVIVSLDQGSSSLN